MRTPLKTAAALVIALFASSAAFADCETRPVTDTEKAHYARVYAALKGALPAAPAGWTMEVRKDSGLTDVCGSDPQGGFAVTVRADYRYQPSADEAKAIETERKTLRRQVTSLDELPPEVKAERQVWLDKMSAANKAENAARKAGDKALASKMSAESEEYSRKGREVRERFRASVRPKVAAIEERLQAMNDHLAIVGVEVSANELFPFAPQPEFGSEIRAGKVPAPRTGGLKIHGVRLVVEGPAARRKTIEALADRKKLAALVE